MDKGIKPVIWTSRATKDLEKITRFYIDLYGHSKARKIATEIRQSTEILEHKNIDTPAVAGIGATISTGGTIVNVGLDVMEGDYESAGKRVLTEAVTGGLSSLVKNAPGVDEAASRIIDSKITVYENVVIPAIEYKIEEKKIGDNQ